MTHYIGIDAHSKTCTAVVMDDGGKIRLSKQFDTTEGYLVQFIKQAFLACPYPPSPEPSRQASELYAILTQIPNRQCL